MQLPYNKQTADRLDELQSLIQLLAIHKALIKQYHQIYKKGSNACAPRKQYLKLMRKLDEVKIFDDPSYQIDKECQFDFQCDLREAQDVSIISIVVNKERYLNLKYYFSLLAEKCFRYMIHLKSCTKIEKSIPNLIKKHADLFSNISDWGLKGREKTIQKLAQSLKTEENEVSIPISIFQQTPKKERRHQQDIELAKMSLNSNASSSSN